MRRGVDGAVLAMALRMTTARITRTRRAVGMEPEQGREPRLRRGKGRRLRTGKEKARGRGRETV
jgi:hypothetical protein